MVEQVDKLVVEDSLQVINPRLLPLQTLLQIRVVIVLGSY